MYTYILTGAVSRAEESRARAASCQQGPRSLGDLWGSGLTRSLAALTPDSVRCRHVTAAPSAARASRSWAPSVLLKPSEEGGEDDAGCRNGAPAAWGSRGGRGRLCKGAPKLVDSP